MGAEEAVVVFGRTTLGLVLVAAGVSKLAQGRAAFVRVVLDYRLLPERLAGAMATALPAVELVTGLLLFTGIASAPAAAVAALLFTAFAVGIVVNLLRGRVDIACGCFGATGHRLSWAMAARNALLTAASIAVARPGPSAFGDDPQTLAVTLSATAVAAIALVLVTTRHVRQLDFGVSDAADADASPRLAYQHEPRQLPLVRSEEGSR